MGNFKDAQAFVSTAYFTVSSISLFLVITFLVMNQYINWTEIFNTSPSLRDELTLLLPIIFVFFSLQLVFKLVVSIYQANQHHSIQVKTQFFTQLLSLLVIYFLIKTGQGSLLLFGCVFSALPVLILIMLNIYGFRYPLKLYKPRYSFWKNEYFKEITELGFKFFILQAASLVLFSTDNMIISHLFGPKEVVPYNIASKYFSIVTIVYTIILAKYGCLCPLL